VRPRAAEQRLLKRSTGAVVRCCPEMPSDRVRYSYELSAQFLSSLAAIIACRGQVQGQFL
jgi:hypothetical protein